MHKNSLSLEIMSPDSQSHGNMIQLSQVDTHELISKVGFWEFALAPLSLEVTAEAYIAGIYEKFILSAGKPMSPI